MEINPLAAPDPERMAKFDRAIAILRSVPSWLQTQAMVLEQFEALRARTVQLVVEGRTTEQATVETYLEGYDIEAGAYLELICDAASFTAYLTFLELLSERARRGVARRTIQFPKPDGINEEFWAYMSVRGFNEKVFDPIGGEIVWLELGLLERHKQWTTKAFRRAADLKLPLSNPVTRREAELPAILVETPADRPRDPKAVFRSNLNSLRTECGWSLDQLCERTGLAKTTVVDHIKGRVMPRLANLKTYADAFSKHLARSVKVTDIKG